ncbi:MAG TPA: hypothetical protein VK116_01895, partial [Planctomycetota bacterium]|nr:hypothetical protein [Planctomycetota bacterium]
NHAPVAVLDDDRSRRVRAMSKSGGERVTLSAEGSRDPDGDSLSYSWWIYREPGTYRGDVELVSREGIETSFLAPRVDEPMTIHVVLEVRDDGTPRLTSFRRAVVTVTP